VGHEPAGARLHFFFHFADRVVAMSEKPSIRAMKELWLSKMASVTAWWAARFSTDGRFSPVPLCSC